MTKPTKRLCIQRRLRSAWASAQSDQMIRVFAVRMKKAWADAQADMSSLGAHSFCCFCHTVAHVIPVCQSNITQLWFKTLLWLPWESFCFYLGKIDFSGTESKCFIDYYSPALKKWGLYWICLVFRNSVIIQMKLEYLLRPVGQC